MVFQHRATVWTSGTQVSFKFLKCGHQRPPYGPTTHERSFKFDQALLITNVATSKTKKKTKSI